jgi:hypothetical protein
LILTRHPGARFFASPEIVERHWRCLDRLRRDASISGVPLASDGIIFGG